ncbi:MAG TPA: hemolysin family protein [Alphaproteobacteria bacterium]|jgi:putative hemolysin|nr:hemolysin family protein [Alphaproteobacteria bacterium]
MDLVIILLLFAANGVFAMAEMAIIASRQVRLEARAEAGSKGAKTALRLKRDPGRFLSTVQTGVTLIGIVMGALSTTAVSAPIALILSHFAWISPALDAGIAFALGVTITTFFSLIIGELVPKQIALRRAEAIAVVSARPFAVVSKIILPAVALLDVTTRLVLRLIGMHRVMKETVSEAEVRTLIAEGTEHGVFHPSEGAMVGRVLRFADRPVRSIMTPRADMVWIDLEAGRDEIGKVVAESRHTRIPVGRSVENIVGVVHIRDLFAHSLRGESLKLGESVTSIPAVYDAIPVLQTLEILRESGSRMALVVDEYGGVEGIVTLTDVLEAIVGELPSAGRSEKPAIVESPAGGLTVDGLVAIEDFKIRLGLQALPGEDEVTTVGGFILTALGRLPKVGDTVTYADYTFEVLSMAGRRVDKLSVKGGPEPLAEDEGG